MIAKIAVSAAVFAIDKPYSYKIPAAMNVQTGMRVSVPFGRGNRKCEGIVLEILSVAEDKLKPIDRVLDETPVLDARALRMAAFLRQRYFCTFYDAVHAILPAGLWFKHTEQITVSTADWETALEGHEAARSLMQTLTDLGGSASVPELMRIFDSDSLADTIAFLKKKKLITSDLDLTQKAKQKYEKIVSLCVDSEQARDFAEKKRKKAPLQKAVLDLLCAVGIGSVSEICELTGASAATINRLADLGLVEITEKEVLRGGVQPSAQKKPELHLNFAQNAAFCGMNTQRKQSKPGVCLLYGVTGSGKTSVYISLISETLSEGKSAILLVPEIALTPQLISLLAAHFGQDVAVLHSALRVTERFDEWRRIKQGKAHVIVGTRSAVFAPAENLGLIILDEEQEHTYKSENSPRYHAKEVAIYRGASENALVVLGSATPSVESMYRAKSGVYSLYTITERYNGKALPTAEIVDMREQLRGGNDKSISSVLYERLKSAAEENKQSILFINRRGNAKCLVCVDCADVPTCPRCSVSLTYHSATNRLMCHYCGFSAPVPAACPSCGGRLKSIGCGTQKVEEELSALLPESRVLRMDADTVRAANSHEVILSKFSEEKIPILLGTQMVTKGLDFENVTLVGVLDADLSLYVNNFRAAESTFSLICQVVGRSGRGKSEGTALIQTMTPDHPVIRLAAEQNYDTFYDMEIEIRKLRQFPPFSDILMFTFSGLSEDSVLKGAMRMRSALEMNLKTLSIPEPCELLGPSPAPVAKVNYAYRYRLTLQTKNTPELRKVLAFLLQAFSKDAQNRGVSVFLDINTYD